MRTKEAAASVGVSTSTLLRWLRTGKVPAPARDPIGWRTFNDTDVARLKRFFDTLHPRQKRAAVSGGRPR